MLKRQLCNLVRQLAAVLSVMVCGSLAFGQAAVTSASVPLPAATVAGPLEDWNSPVMAQSQLVAAPPLIGEKADLDDLTRELLQVQWRASDPIELYVIRPKGVQKPPVILYLYGHPAETTRFQDDEFCRLLVKNGYAAIGFVPNLSGQRYHNRPLKEWYISELQETLATSAHDVQMILNYLESRGDFDMSRVGMFGQGSGASIAILAAAVDPRIKALDLMDPWGDWPEWMAVSTIIPEEERPAFVKPEFLAKVAALDPVQWLPNLKTPSVRLQILNFETITPMTAKDAIAKAAPSSATVTRYDNANQVHDALMMGKEFDWIKAQMRSAVSPVAAKQ